MDDANSGQPTPATGNASGDESQRGGGILRTYPRVAFFTDSYHETNGVAHTSRRFEDFARQEKLPFLCVRAATSTDVERSGSITALNLNRSRLGFGLEHDMRFDFLMWRHLQLARQITGDFQADLIHITGPSDICQLGARIAFLLRIPLAISWHTNLHEYAGKRLDKLFRFLPIRRRQALSGWGEANSLKAILKFYRLGRLLFAPNEELVDLLRQEVDRPTYLMRRGVNTEIFNPRHRTITDGLTRIGYVGRLSAEKNVRFLAELEQTLLDAGKRDFRFVIVGDGSERTWLENHLRFAEFTGILHGKSLSRAYANMDVFVFPSKTDTFGNVILEAQASGVPVIVTAEGGPKFLVNQNTNGFIAREEQAFKNFLLHLLSAPHLREQMSAAARQFACCASWNKVFETVYDAYDLCLQHRGYTKAQKQMVAAHFNSARN
ncbi:MAG: glycosyltransferase [Acidobacteriota bacterium]